jgi:nitrogen fixation/metabolism regulation signal transduction histidine kinase
MEQVDAARANLQTILDNLTAGVIVLSDKGEIRSSNPGATRILKTPLAEYQHQPLQAIPGLELLGAAVQQQFTDFSARRADQSTDHWQHSLELGSSANPMHTPFDRSVTLVARGAELPAGEHLLVFDDISEIVSAQRAQAWGEVARRLAHEIKNPLTPIQLSAERLEMKLSGKLEEKDQVLLIKSVKTIVDQVDAMKRLVNEFRDYARLPAAELVTVDLNTLIREVTQMYDDASAAAPLALDLDPHAPAVKGDPQQLRQVIHNLVQNAQDASTLEVTIKTQWQRASNRVRLSVLDHGPGFDEAVLKRAFEPYVTTKSKGTGLGLAVVKKIADEHGARVDITNRMAEGVKVGAQVSLSLTVDVGAQAITA